MIRSICAISLPSPTSDSPIKNSPAIPASISVLLKKEKIRRNMFSSRLANVSSDEEQRGGTDNPTTRSRRAVAQCTKSNAAFEAPSMDLAFGGVKSRDTRAPHILAAPSLGSELLETPLIFGLYTGMTGRRHDSSFFRYLRRLRADGRTNMYGAIPYLMKRFELDRAAAFEVVCAWLDRESDLQKIEPEYPRPRRRLSSATRS